MKEIYDNIDYYNVARYITSKFDTDTLIKIGRKDLKLCWFGLIFINMKKLKKLIINYIKESLKKDIENMDIYFHRWEREKKNF